jgi:hypothetical protein
VQSIALVNLDQDSEVTIDEGGGATTTILVVGVPDVGLGDIA